MGPDNRPGNAHPQTWGITRERPKQTMRNYFENVKAAIQMFHAREEGQDGFEYLMVVGGISVGVVFAMLLLAGGAPAGLVR